MSQAFVGHTKPKITNLPTSQTSRELGSTGNHRGTNY